jgi:hypothetical protein
MAIIAGNDLLSRHTLASSARELRTWTSAPYPPSPPQRDQHTVVHRLQCCRAFVRRAGHTLYGPESNRLVLPPHFQIGIAPPEGLCSLLVAATTYSSPSNT